MTAARICESALHGSHGYRGHGDKLSVLLSVSAALLVASSGPT